MPFPLHHTPYRRLPRGDRRRRRGRTRLGGGAGQSPERPPSPRPQRSRRMAAKTRFKVTLSKAVTAQVSVMERPDRVIIDLPEVAFHLPAEAGRSKEGLIASYRYGLFAPGRSRVVMELTQPAVVSGMTTAPDCHGRRHDPDHRALPHRARGVPQGGCRKLGRREGSLDGADGPGDQGCPAGDHDRSRPWRHRSGRGGLRQCGREGSRALLRPAAEEEARGERPLQDPDDPRPGRVRLPRRPGAGRTRDPGRSLHLHPCRFDLRRAGGEGADGLYRVRAGLRRRFRPACRPRKQGRCGGRRRIGRHAGRRVRHPAWS